MSWRVAASLLVLRDEVNVMAPNRSKISDGTIGDIRHQGTKSDHNPNAAGVVCAFDITHDPANGADMGKLSEFLRTHQHPSCTYLIFNKHIASAIQGWNWRVYTGDSPHTEHLHVSASNDYDNNASWGLATLDKAAPSSPADTGGQPPPFPLPKGDWFGPESNSARNHSGNFSAADAASILLYQQRLNARGWKRMPMTGHFDSTTADVTSKFQQEKGIHVDGGVGKTTWGTAWTAPIS